MAVAGAPQSEARKRLYWITIICAFWVAIITARLLCVQVYRYSDWMARATKQQQRSADLSPKRGMIYDRNGSTLAMAIEAPSVYAVHNEITDNPGTARCLPHTLQLDAHELEALLTN